MAKPSAAGKFSLSLAGKSAPHSQRATPSTGTITPKFSLNSGSGQSTPLKRATAASLLSEADQDEEETAVTGEEIVAFGHGVKSKREEEEERRRREAETRVIPKIPNRDWREEAKRKRRRQREEVDEEEQARRDKLVEEMEKRDQAPMSYGLSIVQPSPDAMTTAVEANTSVQEEESSAPAPQKQSADDEALAALMGNRTSHANMTTIRPPTPPAPTDEEAVFREAYASAPESATLTEYAATPIDGFGAAILRGYLKPGQTLENFKQRDSEAKKNAPRGVKPRPGLLGLGAKDNGMGIELGAWGKGDRRKAPEVYAPVAMKNKKTGEIISEDEMKQQLEKQKLVDEESARQATQGKSRRRTIEDGRGTDEDRRKRRREEREEDARRDRHRDRSRERKSHDQRRRRDESSSTSASSDHERRRGHDRGHRRDERQDRHRARTRDHRDRRRGRSTSPESITASSSFTGSDSDSTRSNSSSDKRQRHRPRDRHRRQLEDRSRDEDRRRHRDDYRHGQRDRSSNGARRADRHNGSHSKHRAYDDGRSGSRQDERDTDRDRRRDRGSRYDRR